MALRWHVGLRSERQCHQQRPPIARLEDAGAAEAAATARAGIDNALERLGT